MVKETKEILAELKVEVFFNKLMVQLSEMIFMNFSLLLVTFILLINVFSTNVISLGFLHLDLKRFGHFHLKMFYLVKT